MKKIKHIFSIFLGIGLFFSVILTFADSSIRLNLDKQEIDIQEVVELRIDVELENQTDSVQIDIPGIEDFIVLGQSQNQSTRSLNGVVSQNFVLVLSLKGRESGSFEIGPVTIGDIISNTQTLVINGEQVFVGGQPDVAPSLTDDEIEQKTREFGEKLAEEYLKQFEEDKNKQIIEEHGSLVVADEFKGIKALSHISPINLKNSLFLLLFFLLLYIFYKLYIHFSTQLKQKQEEHMQEKNVETIKRQTDYLSILQKIEKNDIDSPKEIFYGKLGSLMREYFDEKVEVGLSSKTFGELRKKIIKYPSLTRIYEKIYFPEYNLEIDTKEQRIEIIQTLKDELI